MDNTTKRIRKAINWIIFNEIAENEKDISEKLGYTKSSFSQIINGKVPLSEKFVNKLLSLDERISKEWLLTGDGEILENDSLISSNSIKVNEMMEKIRDLEETNQILLAEIRRLKSKLAELQDELDFSKENSNVS